MLETSKISEGRIFYALLDFAQDLDSLFSNAKAGYESEPEYEDFVSCFDQGMSEGEINEKYKFSSLKKFNDVSDTSLIGFGRGNVLIELELNEKNRKNRYVCNTHCVTKFKNVPLNRLFVVNIEADPDNKMKVVMKFMKTDTKLSPDIQWAISLAYKSEIRVYKDLKKGQYFCVAAYIIHISPWLISFPFLSNLHIDLLIHRIETFITTRKYLRNA